MDVMKTALVKSRRNAMASSSRLPMQWEREKFEGVNLAEVGHASTSEMASLPGWASESGMHPVQPDR